MMKPEDYDTPETQIDTPSYSYDEQNPVQNLELSPGPTSTVNGARTRKGIGPKRDASNDEKIAQLTKAGYTAQEISNKLNISMRSVSRARVITKTDTEPYEPMSREENLRAIIMLEQGVNYMEVARTLGRSHTTIMRKFPGYDKMTRKESSELGVLIKALNRIDPSPGSYRPSKIEKGPTF